jgi:hypothetical protein
VVKVYGIDLRGEGSIVTIKCQIRLLRSVVSVVLGWGRDYGRDAKD